MQLWRKFFMLVLLLLPAFIFIQFIVGSPKAQALSSGYHWVDRGTIVFVGNNDNIILKYVDDTLDDDFTYKAKTTDGKCETEIKISVPSIKYNDDGSKFSYAKLSNSELNGVSKGRLRYQTFRGNPVNSCSDFRENNLDGILDKNNFNIVFNWMNSGAIESVDGSRKFEKDKDKPNFYLYMGEKSNSCRDFIRVGSSKAEGVYEEIDPDKASGPENDRSKSKIVPECYVDTWGANGQAKSANVVIGNLPKEKDPPKDPSNPTGYTGTSSTGNGTSCEGTAGPLGWIICGLISAIQDTVGKAQSAILDLLQNDPLILTGGSATAQKAQGIRQGWEAVRGLANGLLIIVFLVIIFGQTLSIDAYTVKKAMPRIVAAAILIQLSFLICSIFIDVSNIVGLNIDKMVNFSLGGGYKLSAWFSGTVAVGGVIGLVGLVSAIGSGAAAIFAIGALISLLGALMTLAFREIAIIILIVLAPLAFIAWILPNTEKLFKSWMTNFIKILLMFPLMALIFAVSGFASNIALNQSSDFFQQVIGFIMILAPLFALPFVFKAGGQLMSFGAGMIAGNAGKISKGVKGSEFAKNYKQDKKEQAFQRAEQGGNWASRAFGRAGAKGIPGVTGGGFGHSRVRMRAQLGAGAEAAETTRAKEFEELFARSNPEADELIRYFSPEGLRRNPARARAALKHMQGRGMIGDVERARNAMAQAHDQAYAAHDTQTLRSLESVWNNGIDQGKIRENAGDIAATGIGRTDATGAYISGAVGTAGHTQSMQDYARTVSAKGIASAHSSVWTRLASPAAGGAIHEISDERWDAALQTREADSMTAEQLGSIRANSGSIHVARDLIGDAGTSVDGRRPLGERL